MSSKLELTITPTPQARRGGGLLFLVGGLVLKEFEKGMEDNRVSYTQLT